MRILVDADACPVKAEIANIARRHGVEVLMVASHAHEIREAPGVAVLRVDMSPQAADVALVNQARRGDVVVTGDHGVACMVLGRGVAALSFRGQIYSEENIDGLMASRHMAARARRGGARSRGPRPFSGDDAARFSEALEALLAGRD